MLHRSTVMPTHYVKITGTLGDQTQYIMQESSSITVILSIKNSASVGEHEQNPVSPTFICILVEFLSVSLCLLTFRSDHDLGASLTDHFFFRMSNKYTDDAVINQNTLTPYIRVFVRRKWLKTVIIKFKCIFIVMALNYLALNDFKFQLIVNFVIKKKSVFLVSPKWNA